jgi:hypothetical protein
MSADVAGVFEHLLRQYGVNIPASGDDESPMSAVEDFQSIFWSEASVDVGDYKTADRAFHRVKLRLLHQLMSFSYYRQRFHPDNDKVNSAFTLSELGNILEFPGRRLYHDWLWSLNVLAWNVESVDVTGIFNSEVNQDESLPEYLHRLTLTMLDDHDKFPYLNVPRAIEDCRWIHDPAPCQEIILAELVRSEIASLFFRADMSLRPDTRSAFNFGLEQEKSVVPGISSFSWFMPLLDEPSDQSTSEQDFTLYGILVPILLRAGLYDSQLEEIVEVALVFGDTSIQPEHGDEGFPAEHDEERSPDPAPLTKSSFGLWRDRNTPLRLTTATCGLSFDDT